MQKIYDPALQEIMDRYADQVEAFKGGDDPNEDFIEELISYYAESGEMPYGTAKARDGDPDQWVLDKLEDLFLNL